MALSPNKIAYLRIDSFTIRRITWEWQLRQLFMSLTNAVSTLNLLNVNSVYYMLIFVS